MIVMRPRAASGRGSTAPPSLPREPGARAATQRAGGGEQAGEGRALVYRRMHIDDGHRDAGQVHVTRVDEVARLPAGREGVLEVEEVVVTIELAKALGEAEGARVRTSALGRRGHGGQSQAQLAQ